MRCEVDVIDCSAVSTRFRLGGLSESFDICRVCEGGFMLSVRGRVETVDAGSTVLLDGGSCGPFGSEDPFFCSFGHELDLWSVLAHS